MSGSLVRPTGHGLVSKVVGRVLPKGLGQLPQRRQLDSGGAVGRDAVQGSGADAADPGQVRDSPLSPPPLSLDDLSPHLDIAFPRSFLGSPTLLMIADHSGIIGRTSPALQVPCELVAREMRSRTPDRLGYAPHVEPPQPIDATHQERVKEVVARIAEEAVRLTDRSPRATADLLAELGWHGRGGKRYDDSTVRGWIDRKYAPSAWVLIGLAIYHGISLDQFAYGAGLKAEVDRLRDELNDRGQAIAQLQTDVKLLARTVTSHLQLEPGPAQDLGRIARPEQSQDPGRIVQPD